jgi:adenine-specific DNA-methyltransferase
MEKIDVIYIDPPPYNTGNEFTFNDYKVEKEDSYKHSKWISYMNKRLTLSKRLLSDKGVIFISIDDNEQAQLKILCDEIFGKDNFIAQIIVVSNRKGRHYLEIAVMHEYVLCYSKKLDVLLNKLPKNMEDKKHEDKKGKYELWEL